MTLLELLGLAQPLVLAVAGGGFYLWRAQKNKLEADTEHTLVDTRERVIEAQAQKISDQERRIENLEEEVLDLRLRLEACERRWLRLTESVKSESDDR